MLLRSVNWRAYAQLVRLPNVFTALADIALGWCGALAVGTPGTRWPSFILLLAASACLYSAGMVWNDFFDVEQDRQERPFRPLPSGRIARRTAGLLGCVLILAGLLLAGLAGLAMGGFFGTPLLLAGLLTAAILLYDGWLKRTWAGPLAMGTCRLLNVLLGLSVASTDLRWGPRFFLALAVGVYIVGVTWFARTEARVSRRSVLTAGALVMLAALVLALAVPVWFAAGSSSALFPYLLVGLGFLVGIPVGRATAEPTPGRVQRAVKRALIGLVVLDAVLATALVGAAGLVILVLLLPALYLGRWIYST
jgi:4-hydroxybenzoate polyprenyltransferase